MECCVRSPPSPRQFRENEHLIVTIENLAAPVGWLANADPTVSLESMRTAFGEQRDSCADDPRRA